jgi:DNA/RNA-binding domain of Phe-tRNA-synthetase-like protein
MPSPPFKLRLDPRLIERFPDYTALVIYAEELTNGPSDARSISALRAAEQEQRAAFAGRKAADHPHIQAWRAAYGAFGAKPSKYLCSVEALLARTLKGQDLPAINCIVDLYNAVSMRHILPVGGEDWERLDGDLILTQANGSEPFVSLEAGMEVTTYPETGEVIWADRSGVTCRRWNWRQGRRTLLTTQTRQAYFVLDRLAPYTEDALLTAGEELTGLLRAASPACLLTRVLLGGEHGPEGQVITSP